MRTMTLMWQTSQTGTGQCPAIYAVEGGFVIQGYTTADAGVVFVVADVVDRLAPADMGSIAWALMEVAGGYMVAGDPIVDPGELAQLYQLADHESAVFTAARQLVSA